MISIVFGVAFGVTGCDEPPEKITSSITSHPGDGGVDADAAGSETGVVDATPDVPPVPGSTILHVRVHDAASRRRFAVGQPGEDARDLYRRLGSTEFARSVAAAVGRQEQNWSTAA